MAMDERKLSMYLANTLKVIFEGMNSALNHEGTNYTLVSYDGNDFIRESMGSDGKVDEMKLCQNVGRIVDCDPLMKDRLVSEMERQRVTFAAIETVEPSSDGKVKNWCYFATHKNDRDKVDRILTDLNQVKTQSRMEAEAFLNFSKEKNFPISGVSMIEPEIYKTMQREHSLNFPHCVLRNSNGSYDLRFSALDDDKVHQALIRASVLCSAHTRQSFIQAVEEHDNKINHAISKIVDNHKAFMIQDKDSPDHYIWTDSRGFHNVIRTAAGEQELEFVERTNPRYVSKAYNILHGYGDIEIKPAAEHLKEPEKTEKTKEAIEKEVSAETKVEYYKRKLVEPICEAIERGYLGRLRDNEVSFHAAIDHAVMQKDDEHKLDLQTDKALNYRIGAGNLGETIIDLSDLRGEAFSQRFCETVLGTQHEENQVAKSLFEDEIKVNAMLAELAEQPKEIKLAVINEIDQTIEEVYTKSDYEIDSIDREVFSREIESRDELTIEAMHDDR